MSDARCELCAPPPAAPTPPSSQPFAPGQGEADDLGVLVGSQPPGRAGAGRRCLEQSGQQAQDTRPFRWPCSFPRNSHCLSLASRPLPWAPPSQRRKHGPETGECRRGRGVSQQPQRLPRSDAWHANTRSGNSPATAPSVRFSSAGRPARPESARICAARDTRSGVWLESALVSEGSPARARLMRGAAGLLLLSSAAALAACHVRDGATTQRQQRLGCAAAAWLTEATVAGLCLGDPGAGTGCPAWVANRRPAWSPVPHCVRRLQSLRTRSKDGLTDAGTES